MASFKLEDLDALKNAGLLKDDTYQQAVSRIPQMSSMSEQVPQSVEQPSPIEQPNIIDANIKNIQNLNAGLSLGQPVESKEQAINTAKELASNPNSPLDERERAVNFLYQNKQEVDNQKAYEDAQKIAESNRTYNRASDFNEKAAALGLPTVATPDDVLAERMQMESIPTPQDISQAAAPIKQVAAQEKAVQNEILKKEQAQEQAIKNADQAVEQAKQDSEPEDDMSFGQKLLRALAIGFGAYGQAMGAGENVALRMIDSEQRKKAESKKLTQEQALADRKYRLDQAELLLKQQSNNTDSVYKKAQMEKMRAELNAENIKTQSKLATIFAAKNPEGIDVEDLHALDPETKELSVMLPNGKYSFAKDKMIKGKLEEYTAETGPALAGIEEIKKLASELTLANKLNPLDPKRREIETRMIALVGNLRLPFTGPGQLLEKEYERLRGAIGNPNKILTLPESELAALNAVSDKLTADTKLRYSQAGIKIPMTRQEKEIELLSRQNPNVPREKIQEFYLKARK